MTASKGVDVAKDIPIMISNMDFYAHVLAGMVAISITLLPDILDFEVDLIKVKFPGPNGKYYCLETALPGVKLPACPTSYFINAPGDSPAGKSSLTLSTFPLSIWCTESPDKKSMCPWSSGRESEEAMEADQSLDLARGKCKQSLHCKNKDFDGYVMSDSESIDTSGSLITWNTATFRDKNNYRSDSDHQNKLYSAKFGTELVAGVERPIQSYVMFEVSDWIRSVVCLLFFVCRCFC